MFMPIAVIIMIFGLTSVINYAQEAPSRVMTEEEIMQSKEFQDLMEAQTAFSEFTGDSSSSEYTSLEDNLRQKQEAFENIIPKDQSTQLTESPELATEEASSESAPLSETTEPREELPSSDENTSPQEDQSPSSSENIQETPQESTPASTTNEMMEIQEDNQSSAPETPITPTTPSLEEQEALIPEGAISEEPVGIDTVSLENPQGNWLFKRIWWERAEERYERIRILVDGIWESRNTFFKERNQLDRNVLDPFYMSIGIDRGELQIILSEINDFLEQQREQQGDLTEQERLLYQTYATEEETLKQLKLDVDMITNLDQAIDDALGTFMNQINRVKSYEADAWKNFKEIAHILNDTRARELYYMIEGAARNIKTISIYLEQEFFAHFNKLVNEAKTRVARVQSQMDALKEKGVLFQRQAEQLEQQQTTAEDQEDEDDQEQSKPKPKLGWIDWMTTGVSDVLGYVWSLIRMPYDMIVGK